MNLIYKNIHDIVCRIPVINLPKIKAQKNKSIIVGECFLKRILRNKLLDCFIINYLFARICLLTNNYLSIFNSCFFIRFPHFICRLIICKRILILQYD